jgi:hypothetical protein
MEFDVFGRRLIVERALNGWVVFYPYEEGKRRQVPAIQIPRTSLKRT